MNILYDKVLLSDDNSSKNKNIVQLSLFNDDSETKKVLSIKDIPETILTELSQRDLDYINSIPYYCIKRGIYKVHRDKYIIAKYWTGMQYLYLYKYNNGYLLTNI